jgi:hypothetical protein
MSLPVWRFPVRSIMGRHRIAARKNSALNFGKMSLAY